MRTLHFISHTHWDREWHEPFQVFRLRLVQTIDKMLDILAQDPDYRYFMLDGQTIVLEDYVEVRPEREAELREHIQKGRVLVGPWYVLPDEFLVSGESIIRNLQRGMQIASDFGRSMLIGYIPDPFGHISQMPQILKGFGIDRAMFRRGLADEPTELWWEGADGTRVLVTYLRDGYDNGAWLPQDAEGFNLTLARLVESLAPYAVTDHILVMHGTDHMQPWPGLPVRMREAEAFLPETRILHSNFIDYTLAVEQALPEEGRNLPVVHGELRNPKRHHLLPGVTSTRMWIKQRNMQAQVLLQDWAEPLAAAATQLDSTPEQNKETLAELALAWKYLLQNHPHDSICGCSIDQVHTEMVQRFDWVEQIGGSIVERAREPLVAAIDTRYGGPERGVAVVVLNPAPAQRGAPVTVEFDMPKGWEAYQVLDADGQVLPSADVLSWVEDYQDVTADAGQLRWAFGEAQAGTLSGYRLRDFDYRVEGSQVYADVTVSNQGQQDAAVVQRALEVLGQLTVDPAIELFHLRVHSLKKDKIEFYARDLPGNGYATFWLVPAEPESAAPQPDAANSTTIENQFLRVSANPQDGTLTISDKTTGAVFEGANRFADGGDRGDLYNYCPPERDQVVSTPIRPPTITVARRPGVADEVHIEFALCVPRFLAPDRSERSAGTTEMQIATDVRLYQGARRVDMHTRVNNPAEDHRLRVLFPTPIRANESLADQAFDLVARPVYIGKGQADWVEQPVPTFPLQKFVTIRDEEHGVALATRGLMEYEVMPAEGDGTGVCLALTLLRCVGWLSRPDLHNRRGDAGPEKRTPGAQEPGVHEFEYSLIPYSADYLPGLEGGIEEEERPQTWREARAAALGFAAPPRAFATDEHSGSLPVEGSWAASSDPDFILTAVKPPLQGEGLVVRGYYAGDKGSRVQLRPFRVFKRAARTDLNEVPVAALEPNAAGEVEFDVRPREIVTVRFED